LVNINPTVRHFMFLMLRLYSVSQRSVIQWNGEKWKLLTALHQTKVHLRDNSSWNLKFHSDISFIWIILNVKLSFVRHRWFNMEFLVIVYTGSGRISSEILINLSHWVKEIWNVDRQCKTTLFSYLTQVWLNINRKFFQLDHEEHKLHFNDDDVCFVLNQHA